MTAPYLSAHPDGVVVEVWVVPGASRDSIDGTYDGAMRVRTAAPAEGGRANRAVARLVAARFGARRATVISGETSRRKRVLVAGTTLATAQAAVAKNAGNAGNAKNAKK